MQDEVKVSQADRGVFGEVLACLSTANELRAAKDCNQAQQAIFWEQKALSVLARHRHQAERETLARMEPVAWLYTSENGKKQVTSLEQWAPHIVAEIGATEVALYALPPAPEAGQ